MQLANTGETACVEQLNSLCQWLRQEAGKTDQRSQVEWPQMLRAMAERATFLEHFTIPEVERVLGNQLPAHRRDGDTVAGVVPGLLQRRPIEFEQPST